MNRFVILAAALLVACAETPSPTFYVLEAGHVAPMTAQGNVKPRTIGIGPVTIPSLVERKQIVTRNGSNNVQIAEFQHWAAPLKDNIVSVLQQNIAGQLPNDVIRTYPWSAFGNVDQHIVIDITRFDASLGQSITVEANWVVLDENSHVMLSSGHSLINKPLQDGSYQAVTAGFSQALTQMGRELAAALLR
ncbi:hypothetical protein JCM14076_07740 [Methylosoma difficile]